MASPIFFEKSGSGEPVILLHGFPMNRRVWNGFASALSANFNVYTPDLPGFGESPLLPGSFSLETVASEMLRWMEEEKIDKPAAIVGHSMGGYVALEMVRISPASFSSLTLFHSTALEDSPEKKESRTKVLKFIDDNGVLAFTSNFIQPLFGDQNHPAISSVRDITMEATADAVKGYTRAMRDRRDNQHVLRSFPGRILLIGGGSDKGIPAESLITQAELRSGIKVVIFPETGHMGMKENRDETLSVVRDFLRENRPTREA